MNNILLNLGLKPNQLNEALLEEDYDIGRVSSQHHSLYKILTEKGEFLAKTCGKFNHNILATEDYPVVGDFVLINKFNDFNSERIIHKILSRNTVIKRKSPGSKQDVQILASNIDVAFICTDFNYDFNLRRIERYLTMIWDSMATPVIVLTKMDCCDDSNDKLEKVKEIAPNVDILMTSKDDQSSVLNLLQYLDKNVTAVFLGSSGVGKSTLINLLIGEDLMDTHGIRQDGKGRHTTTHRQLIRLNNGSILIDTPGLREIQIDADDLSKTYPDISSLAEQCKFRNCSHTNEPDCAVLKAIKNNELPIERLNSYNKLLKETEYQSLDSKEIENKKIKSMFGGKNKYKKLLKEVKLRKNY